MQAKLKSLYRDIDQLELVVGLFAEEPTDGALFGSLMNTMVAVDAFTQALTNPLLSTNVFSAQTLTDYGLATINETPSLQALAARNLTTGTDVNVSFDYREVT